MDSDLNNALKRIEKLITRDAESFVSSAERLAEFQLRLARTEKLLDLIGNPDHALNAIHIAGTSGKGSVAMLCEAILLAAGHKVGTHTSPYLQTPLEKVRVAGRMLTAADDVVTLTERVMEAVKRLQAEHPDLGHPHYAEAWLGLALRHFADTQCEPAVIETGMGGRFDATNVLRPRVCVITTVHYDHVRVLGGTLEEIAWHKAGVIKPNTPIIVGHVGPEALRVIEHEASVTGAPMTRLGKEFDYQIVGLSDHGGVLDYRSASRTLGAVEVKLLGAHQLTNAALAIAALEAYTQSAGWRLDEQAIREGLGRVRFAGRLEVMQHDPTVVLDGAHNEEKIAALAAALREVFPHRRLILVLGMLETKNALPMLHALSAQAEVIITTSPSVKGKPALSAEELASVAKGAGARMAYAGGPPHEALAEALRIAESTDLVVITGSLYLIGEIRAHWHHGAEISTQGTLFTEVAP